MKIIVYAIAKNEEKNYEEFINSMSEADGIFILDTGSEDALKAKQSVLAYSHLNVYWSDDYKPTTITPQGVFDFSDARNQAYELAFDRFHDGNQTYYISMDLDERFEPGWCYKLKGLLSIPKVPYNQITFKMNISEQNPYNYDAVRGHLEHMCEWVYPVHEVLDMKSDEIKENFNSNINIYHHPDDNKNRTYLPSLLHFVSTYPCEPRAYHYLGREYMMKGLYTEALNVFNAYLNLGENGIYLWNAETAIIYNYIGFCYEHLGDFVKVEQAYMKAALEVPQCREPWLDLSDFYVRKSDTLGAYFYLVKALSLPETTDYMYTKPVAYGSMPHHQACFLSFQLGFKDKSKQHIKDAVVEAKGKLTPSLITDYVTMWGSVPEEFKRS